MFYWYTECEKFFSVIYRDAKRFERPSYQKQKHKQKPKAELLRKNADRTSTA